MVGYNLDIQFDPQNHRYYVDNKLTPSVTQILGLANLYEFIDKRLLEKAGRFGTAVHKATELFDEGTLDFESLDVALIPYLEGWKKFLTDTKFELLESESIVASKLGFAGTYDRVGYFNKKLTLLDIKTTAIVPKTTCLQLSAYTQAFQEMTGKHIEQRICVRLKPMGYTIDQFHDQLYDFLIFKKFLDVYLWSHDG